MRKQGNHWNFFDVFLIFAAKHGESKLRKQGTIGFFVSPPVFCWMVGDVFLSNWLLGTEFCGPRNWIHIPPIKGHGLLRLFASRIEVGREFNST